MEVVFDLEADSLDPTKIHVVVAKEVGVKGNYVITGPKAFAKFASKVTKWIAHNGIGYDIPVIEKLWGYKIPLSKTVDTLVLSRLFDPQRKGGHSLKVWGERLGDFKDDYTGGFEVYTEEMKAYCKQDVKVTELLYNTLLKEGTKFSQASINLEHMVHAIMCEQQRHGFELDIDLAQEIYTVCLKETNRIEEEIKEFMVPIVVPTKTVTLKYKKDGDIFANQLMEGCNVQGDYTKIMWEEFNLGSPTQINKRLDRLGWKPTVKTKSGESYKICPENLATIPDTAPQAVKGLKTWKVLETRW
jgi:DNA polymerase-1